MSKKRMCKFCQANPATVPDRDNPYRGGKLFDSLCYACHGKRLSGDMRRILAIEAAKRLNPPESMP